MSTEERCAFEARLNETRHEGMMYIAGKLLRRNWSLDAIEEHTGLTREEVELAGNLSLDERGLANLRSRRKFQTDYDSDLATAEDRGRREARTEGRREGRTEGVFDVARNLLKLDIPLDKIIAATGLTGEDIERLRV